MGEKEGLFVRGGTASETKYYIDGSEKKAAKPLFEKAKKLFETFKPEITLFRVWGRTDLDYFLSQYQ